MSTDELLKEKREEILRTASKHGARNVRVFGSVARGEDRPDSDVDLLVEVGPDRTPFFPGGLIADLEELLGKRFRSSRKRVCTGISENGCWRRR